MAQPNTIWSSGYGDMNMLGATPSSEEGRQVSMGVEVRHRNVGESGVDFLS